MIVKKTIINLLNKLPYIRGLHQEHLLFWENSCYPVGHYASPIVLVDNIKKREHEIWNKAIIDSIPGIDLRVDEQIKLVGSFSKYYADIPFKPGKQPNLRYYYDNEYYLYTDGIVLFSMIRHIKPSRIIEIGSGFSSAIMLDTNELFFNNTISLTFIEPYPERLFSLLKDTDKKQATIIQSDAQLIQLDTFRNLQAGDILFIDSTHVVKTGNDVNYILFEVLPELQSGVIIHFHDIFYPFEYPKEWVLKGRNWNENYFLRAFLMYNNKFEIILFADYLHKHHKEAFKNIPLCYNNTGGNLWIMKK
jgi:hypothetical protein